MALVVDASVVVKWTLPEEFSDRAEQLLLGADALIAPDFLQIEIANFLAMAVRGDRMPQSATGFALRRIPKLVQAYSSALIVEDALQLALRYGRSVYDCLYVALAVQEGCRFVTADRRLFRSLESELPDTMYWIEEVQLP